MLMPCRLNALGPKSALGVNDSLNELCRDSVVDSLHHYTTMAFNKKYAGLPDLVSSTAALPISNY